MWYDVNSFMTNIMPRVSRNRKEKKESFQNKFTKASFSFSSETINFFHTHAKIGFAKVKFISCLFPRLKIVVNANWIWKNFSNCVNGIANGLFTSFFLCYSVLHSRSASLTYWTFAEKKVEQQQSFLIFSFCWN